MTDRVLTTNAEELTARIEQHLERLHMTRDELEDRARRGLLTGNEFWLYEDIRAFEFLRGDGAPVAG